MGCEKMQKIKYRRKVLEQNRTSIFTDDLLHCYVCGKPREDLHEIIYGTNRINSIRAGYVLPLCRQCHQAFHSNRVLTKKWTQKCQQDFEKNHSRIEWLMIFHRNYLD